MLTKKEIAEVNQVLEKAVFRVDDNLIKFTEQVLQDKNQRQLTDLGCWKMTTNGDVAVFVRIDCP